MSRDMRRRSRSRSPRRGGGGDFRGNFGENKYVYLSNLPYELRWMELKTLIREKAGEVTFVEIIEQRNGRPKGCALVEFTTIEGARDAIVKLNSVEIQGRNIVAKDIKNPEAFFKIIKEETGIDFLDKGRGGSGSGGGARGAPGGGAPRRHDSPPRNGEEYELYGLSPAFLKKMQITPPLSNRIFACNIAFNATSGCIWDIFAMAGKVLYVDLQIDKEGKSKGQALVEFSHPLEAVQAISMFHNQKYYDRTLAVKMDRFEKRNKLGKGELPRGLASIGMGLGAGGAPLTDIASVISTMPPSMQQQPQPPQHMQPPQMQPPPMQQMQQQQPPQMGGGGGGGPMGRDMDAIMSTINGVIGMGGGGGMGGMPPQGEYKPEPMYGGGPPSQLQQQQRPQGGGYGDAPMAPAPYGAQPQQQQAYGRDQAAPAPPGGFGASPARPQQQPAYGREPVFRDNAPVFGGNPMPAMQQQQQGGGGPQGGYNTNGGAYGSGGGGGGMGGYAPVKKEDYAPAYSGAYPDQRMGQQGGGAPFSSRVILIKNLPLDYTWQIVRDRSMTFGEVEHCDLVSPGVARVRFALNSEAERARGALAGTSVEGRPITVDFVM